MLREHKSAMASVAERRATSMVAGAPLAGAAAVCSRDRDRGCTWPEAARDSSCAPVQAPAEIMPDVMLHAERWYKEGRHTKGMTKGHKDRSPNLYRNRSLPKAVTARQMESIRSDRAISLFENAAAKAECDLARRGVRMYTIYSCFHCQLKLGPTGIWRGLT